MTGPTEDIGRLQNEDDALRICMATRQAFDDAQLLMLAQLTLTVGLPVIASIVTLVLPEARPWAVMIGLLALTIDVLFLDRRHKQTLKLGARLGEEFDHRVLSLPWNGFVVDEHPAPEEIHRLATRYETRPGKGLDRVRDWYPAVAANAPLQLGRIICQRANLRYDAQLRRSYALFIQIGGLALIGFLVVSALIQNATGPEILIALTPTLPVINWACREYYRQIEAATNVERLVTLAAGFWADALAGACDSDRCLLRSREFQDAIYAHRSRAPSPLPVLYEIKRLNLEDEMNAAATDFLKAYERHLSGTSAGPDAPPNGP